MRLFISYARVDTAVVQDWLVRPLRVAHHDVWIDDQLQAGQIWRDQLMNEIQRCDALVFAMTPESVTSPECQKELEAASSFGKQIIPVLLQARTPVPNELSHIQYVDFTSGPTSESVARLLGSLQNQSAGSMPATPSGSTLKFTKKRKPVSPELLVSILAGIVIPIALFILSRPAPDQNTSASATETSIPTLPAIISTATARPTTPSATNAATATQFSIADSVPCTAVITPNSPSNAVPVRRVANPTNAPYTTVRQGEQVNILSRSQGNVVFYEIQLNNQTLGWVEAEDLALSGNCP